MEIQTLTQRFSHTTGDQEKAIFSSLFILGNRLQTLFDSHIPALSLKQFMLLSLVRQAREPLTFTQLGELLGCSRQNVKKLAGALEKKGFVTLTQSPRDVRAMCICPTGKVEDYFQTEFSGPQRELGYLFEGYSPQEVETLFLLLTRLYAGVDALEGRLKDEKSGSEVSELA